MRSQLCCIIIRVCRLGQRIDCIQIFSIFIFCYILYSAASPYKLLNSIQWNVCYCILLCSPLILIPPLNARFNLIAPSKILNFGVWRWWQSEKFPKIGKVSGQVINVSSSLWLHVSRVTCLSECSMIVFFNNGSQLLSYSVTQLLSDKGTYRAVRGQLKIQWVSQDFKVDITANRVDPILQCKWLNLVGKSVTLSMHVVPSGGQICNQCKWRHLVAKFRTNASDAICWSNLQLREAIL